MEDRGWRLIFFWVCLGVLFWIFLLRRAIPLSGVLLGPWVPLPILLAGWRLGVRSAVILVAVSLCLVLSLNPPGESLWGGLQDSWELLAVGLILSLLHHRGWAAERAIIFTVLALSLTNLLILVGQGYYLGLTPQALLAQKAQGIAEGLKKLAADAGAGAPVHMVPGLPALDLAALLRKVLPALLVINTTLVVWINVVLARQLASILGMREADDPPLYLWYTPEWLIFALLGAGFLALVPVPQVKVLSLNLLLILALLYFSQGVAVVSAWLNRLQVPRFLRVPGYLLLFWNPMFILTTILGLLDLWLDFRRLQRPRSA
jgi:hypothetical protein